MNYNNQLHKKCYQTVISVNMCDIKKERDEHEKKEK